MTRLNLALLAILIACALGVVTSQHHARKLFSQLQREQARAQELEVEWGKLQLEQRTWATHARVEDIAKRTLNMSLPDSARIRVISVAPPQLAQRAP